MRKGGLSKFHAMAIFTVLAVKVLKKDWNMSEISLSRREKGHNHRENISRRKKMPLCLRNSSRRETKRTSCANISLLP